MSGTTWVTENALDEWVRSHEREAQGVVVDLVERLVAAAVPRPRDRRFPRSDSIEQPGEDGRLDTDVACEPFVPGGLSLWEIGVSIVPIDKATSDYKKLTDSISEAVRKSATFVFVTPLSGRRGWIYDGSKSRRGKSGRRKPQVEWIEEYRQRHDWGDVRVIDGTKLIDWLSRFPSVDVWLANIMGIPVRAIQTPEQYWSHLSSIGEPVPLTPEVFLANREAACKKLEELLTGAIPQLRLTTHYPEHLAAFVSAYVAAMGNDSRMDVLGRCAIVSDSDAWTQMTMLELHDRHVLVAGFSLDDADMDGALLVRKAQQAGYSVVLAGLPGGIPDSHIVRLPEPRIHDLAAALEKAGYGEQRARSLARKSGGNLSTLLRILQSLPIVPEWAKGVNATDLGVAQLLGGWNESLEADKTLAGKLAGREYDEWIGRIREIALRPNTPLMQRGPVWKMSSRYEGWYCLGPTITDDRLDLLRQVANDVLCEPDPQFELPTKQRFAAAIHGKTLRHSEQLRKGLVETLALVGSCPKALVSCSKGKAEFVATLTVRDSLLGADWIRWASLNDLLPLLAEAAPDEFLDIMEKTLLTTPCPFDIIFAQESSDFGGGNYMTGVLWALETLAWDPDYLTTAVIILGELATRDPGGNWGNRPANSLSTILQPWLPQTCASVAQRKVAIQTLLRESPNVGWRLLLDLLPDAHQVSMGSRRPAWRETIPDDWVEGVSQREHWEQVCVYADVAVNAANDDVSKLVELTDRLDDLPEPARKRFLAHIGSERVVSTPEVDRFQLWDHLTNLVSKHRRFADAEWALKPETIDEIDAVAHMLAPKSPLLTHRRLFCSDYLEFFDDKIEYEEQERRLDEQQQKAVRDIYATTGPERLLTFARNVKSPMRVGSALGAIADDAIDRSFLPSLLRPEQDLALRDFIRGYVLRRLQTKGWSWVDGLGTPKWNPSETGQLLICLPFSDETWRRASLWLADDDSLYWSKAVVNPYVTDEKLEFAVDRLVAHDRPYAAIRCIASMIHEKKTLDGHQIVRALLATLHTSETPAQGRGRDIAKAVQAVQEDSEVDRDEVAHIEWVFLPLLDGDLGASPKFLERHLAEEPSFFCEVIRTVFRSEKEQDVRPELTEEQARIAGNAYRLLDEWRTPPGSREDGTFDGDALHTWFESTKTISGESGHLGSAMRMAGKVLMYVPADPDGLWLHHAAAEALNARDADDLRSGFRTGLFNSRGAHWVDPKGQEERNLANKYREQADQVESAGYQRLAATLRQLASEYDHEADQQVLEDRLDE